jgi:hypothetical protein
VCLEVVAHLRFYSISLSIRAMAYKSEDPGRGIPFLYNTMLSLILEMLCTPETLEGAVHHDSQSGTQGFTFLHAKREGGGTHKV